MASGHVGTHVDIPDSTSTVSVSIVNTTTPLTKIPTGFFFGPPIKGFDTFDVVAFAFLVTRKDPTTNTTRKIVFDLGPPKEWRQYLDPGTATAIQGWVSGGAGIDVSGDLADILAKGGTDLKSIESVIWSHPHWDHIGRPALFPPSVSLLCGPGVQAKHGKGYPEVQTAAYLSSEVAGRDFKELSFDNDLKIGGFNAIDFFCDGSFYLLQVPGHCVGHMNALARVTSNPDSFIFMGADTFHHAGQIRPSKGVPLPQTVDLGNEPTSTEKFSKLHPSTRFKNAGAGSGYDDFTAESDFRTTPFTTIQVQADGTSIAHDLPGARAALGKLQKFDSDDRVFVVPAHDISLKDVVEYFPKAPADDWKEKGWKEKGRWLFLRDFEAALNSTEEGGNKL